jgi:hypothetical protein
MNLLGIHLTLLIGPTVAVPAPAFLTEALESVEVTHTDAGRSGFQLSFHAGRGGILGAMDYPLLSSPLLRPFSRIILIVTLNVQPRVLMDGLITHQQFDPGSEPGSGMLTITGEDVSVMMDLEEKSAEHPAQSEAMIAAKLIASYARYGLVPEIVPPPSVDLPLPIERIPVQQGTDLDYLERMAQRFGYVFYVKPGPAPYANVGYWGPPTRFGLPQRALSANLGAATNVLSIRFENNVLNAEFIDGRIQDRLTDRQVPVHTYASTRVPLSSQPAWLVHRAQLRRARLRGAGGLSVTEAYARAQGQTNASSDVITASGELDALRYGDVLQARGLVGLRGVGYSHDGNYYVQSVTHRINRGSYRQSFTLTREGQGAQLPLVRA